MGSESHWTENSQERFRPAKVFADAVSNESLVSGRSGQITSLAFDSTGERCVSTGEDDALHIWDSMKGKSVQLQESLPFSD